MEKLHPKAVWLFFFQILFGSLILALFLAGMITGAIADKNPITASGAMRVLFIFLIVFVIYIPLCYILARLSYHFWRYELAENAVKIEKGIIWKKYISIPYDRIQNVDIYRGVFARLLGLSDLQLQTAGYSGQHKRTEGRMPGLSPEIAEQLREKLVQRVRSTKQGL